MKIYQDFKMALAMLDSYKRKTISIKREINPTFYDLSQKIVDDNKKNNLDNQYFRTLRNMTQNYGVDFQYAKSANDERSLFYNSTVSFSYIKGYLDKMHNHFYTIENNIALKIEGYEEIAKQFNVAIDDDIALIKAHVETYKSTDIYNEFYKECERKNDLLKELENCINGIENESFKLSLKKEIPANSFIGQNYPTDFRKSPELSVLVDILDRVKEEFKNYFVENKDIVDLTPTLKLINDTDDLFKTIHTKIRLAGYQPHIADILADNEKDKSVLGFLKAKNNEDDLSKLEYRIYQLPEWSKDKHFILCEDGSALIKPDNHDYQEIFSSKEMVELRNRLIGGFINQEFKKNPNIAKIFKHMKDTVYVEYIDNFSKIMNKYKENEGILKANDFKLLQTFNEIASKHGFPFTIYEKFDDEMSKTIRTHKVKQFIHSIASKKYEHLYNEDTYKVAGELYDLNLPDNSLQDYIGKKLAAFKTPEQFNAALGSFVDSFNSFTAEATLKKAATFGVDVISEKDNIVILRIEDYEQSYTMGSTSWCISRDEAYFKSYADDREQYFIYDFSKRSTDNTSMIGVTLETNGDYNIAHYKDDSDCYENEESLISYLQEAVSEFKNNVKNQSKSTIKSKISL